MALSQPRNVFGVHSVTPYNRTTGLFYGIIKVLKGSSLSLTGESVELMGGSQKFAWAVEDGAIKAEMSLKFSQFEDFMFELFLGAAPTPLTAEATGGVTAIANKKGTSVVAATGIASVLALAGSETDMKFGKYVVKATDATHVDVYFSSDADLGRGTDGTFQNDLLKITSAPLAIAQATPVTIPNFGVKLTGGAGVIALVADDTATFEVRPINSGSSSVVIGGAANQTFPEFGCIVMAQKRGNQELFEIDAYRCKAAGMPIGFEANTWAEAEVKVKVFYDSALDGVFKMRSVKPA